MVNRTGTEKFRFDVSNSLNNLDCYIRLINDQIKAKMDEKIKLNAELDELRKHVADLEDLRSDFATSLSDYDEYLKHNKCANGGVPENE